MKRFADAFNGIVCSVKSQKNMKIHIAAAIVVIGCGFFFKVSNTEWSILIITIGLVLSAEIFNTAIELLCDFIEPNHDKKIGLVKDAAAGAVLVLSVAAFLVGLIILLPKILNYV
jgi:diacylglycerol kinase